MRKVLALLLMIVAIAVAVSGYSWALVNNDVSAARIATDNALLTVTKGDGAGNTGIVGYTENNGELLVDFRQGLGGARGFQDKSEYTFTHVVKVINNSQDKVKVLGAHDQDGQPCGLYAIKYETGKPDDWEHDFYYGPATLAAGDSFQMNFYFSNEQIYKFAPTTCNFLVKLTSEVVKYRLAGTQGG